MMSEHLSGGDGDCNSGEEATAMVGTMQVARRRMNCEKLAIVLLGYASHFIKKHFTEISSEPTFFLNMCSL